MKHQTCIDCGERQPAMVSRKGLCRQCREARKKANKAKWKAKHAQSDRDLSTEQIEAKLRELDSKRKAARWAVAS